MTGEIGGSFGTITTDSRRDLQIPVTVGYSYGGGGTNSLAPAGRYVVVSHNGTNVIHPGASHWENLYGHNGGLPFSNDDAFLAINGSPAVATFFRQPVSLVPNQQYRISVWALNAVADATGNPEVGVRIVTSTGTVIASDTTGILPARTGSGATLNSPWQEAAVTFNSGAGGTLFLEAYNVSTASSGNDFAIDDVAITPLTQAGCPADYGDAPDTGIGTGTGNYQTLALDGGPRHNLVGGLLLGAGATSEVNGLQNSSASGDTNDDGVTFSAIMTNVGGTVTIPASVLNSTGTNAFARGFVDFNSDGDFSDTGEQSAILTVPSSGVQQSVNFVFTAPIGLTDSNTFMRFRLARVQSEISAPTGNAASGEVEDYPVSVTVVPRIVITKVSNGGVGTFSFSGNNGVTVHTITTVTSGTGVAGPARILTATNTATTVTEAAPPAGFSLQSINCTGLSAGGTATPTINGTAGGSVLLDAAAIGTTGNIACTFTNKRLEADLAIAKTNNVTVLASGATTNYIITVTNNGPDAIAGALVKDTPVSGLTCTPANTVTIVENGVTRPNSTVATLTSTGVVLGTLAIGQTATLTFSCTVN